MKTLIAICFLVAGFGAVSANAETSRTTTTHRARHHHHHHHHHVHHN